MIDQATIEAFAQKIFAHQEARTEANMERADALHRQAPKAISQTYRERATIHKGAIHALTELAEDLDISREVQEEVQRLRKNR